jgi:hypothetical protein
MGAPGKAGWGFWTIAVFSVTFVPLRIATVAPAMNPTRNAITTSRITVSFFIFISPLSVNFILNGWINQMEDIYESPYQGLGFLRKLLDEGIYGEGAKIVEI